MNTYNKLLLDEIQAQANLLAKYLDSANLNRENRDSVTNALEAAIDSLDTAGILIKDSINNEFNKI